MSQILGQDPKEPSWENYFDDLFSDDKSVFDNARRFFLRIHPQSAPEQLKLKILERIAQIIDILNSDLRLALPVIESMPSFQNVMRLVNVTVDPQDKTIEDVFSTFDNFFEELADSISDKEEARNTYEKVQTALSLLREFHLKRQEVQDFEYNEDFGITASIDDPETQLEQLDSFLFTLATRLIDDTFVDEVGMYIPDKTYRKNIKLEKLFEFAIQDMAHEEPENYARLQELIQNLGQDDRNRFRAFIRAVFEILRLIGNKSHDGRQFAPEYVAEDQQLINDVIFILEDTNLDTNALKAIHHLINYIADFGLKKIAEFIRSLMELNQQDENSADGDIAEKINLSIAELETAMFNLMPVFKERLDFRYESNLLEAIIEISQAAKSIVENLKSSRLRKQQLEQIIDDEYNPFEYLGEPEDVIDYLTGFFEVVGNFLSTRADDFIDLYMYVKGKVRDSITEEDYDVLYQNIINYLDTRKLPVNYRRKVIAGFIRFFENNIQGWEMGDLPDRFKHPLVILFNRLGSKYLSKEN